MPFNTGNPLGSSDARDLSDNMVNLDTGTNDITRDVWTDRLGRKRITWRGMESAFEASQQDRTERFASFLASSGYEFVGDYDAGVEITSHNQVVTDENGEVWRLSNTTRTPYTTAGTGLPEGGAFISVGDAALRQELNTSGEEIVRATTATGEQSLGEALDKRVLQIDTIPDLLALDKSSLPDGLAAVVAGLNYHFSATHNAWLCDEPLPSGVNIVGHRGARFLAPENTMAAYSNAYTMGLQGIEGDLHLTSDGEVVIIHDDTVDRTTDGSGNVSDFTLAELRALDAGSWYHPKFAGCKLPTLDEYIQYGAPRFSQIRCEIKEDAVIPKLLEALDAYNAQDVVVVSSFDINQLVQVRQGNSRVGLMLLGAGIDDIDTLLNTLGGKCWLSITSSNLLANPQAVQDAHQAGISVTALPTNDETTALKLLDIGCNVIATDMGVLCQRRSSGAAGWVPFVGRLEGWVSTTPEGLTISNGRLKAEKTTGDNRVGVHKTIPVTGGDLVEVEFFARATTDNSGAIGVFLDESGSGSSVTNLYVTKQDVYKYKFTKYITVGNNGDDVVPDGFLFFGVGGGGTGGVEFFDVNIRVNSRYFSGFSRFAQADLEVYNRDGGEASLVAQLRATSEGFSYNIDSVSVIDAVNGLIQIAVTNIPRTAMANPVAQTKYVNGDIAFRALAGEWVQADGVYVISVANPDGTALDLTTAFGGMVIDTGLQL